MIVMARMIFFAVDDPKSKLSRENVVETCKTCHPSANRQFAGYLTHATHHDPVKYPILFWVFWGMTGLLVGTFLHCRITYNTLVSTFIRVEKKIKKDS